MYDHHFTFKMGTPQHKWQEQHGDCSFNLMHYKVPASSRLHYFSVFKDENNSNTVGISLFVF